MKTLSLTATMIGSLLFSSFNLSAFTIKTGEDGKMLHWPGSRISIFYKLGTSKDTSSSEIIRKISAAFTEWEIKSEGELAFIYAGDSDKSESIRDGINGVIWIDEGWKYGEKVAAVSIIWPSNDGNSIDEVDIEFNGQDFDWSSPMSPGIGATALHEIGHLLGIGHSFNPGAVMHDITGSASTIRLKLSRDDLEALLFLYPGRDRELNRFDLPVLFYPKDFPGEPSILPAAEEPDPGSGRWISTLGGCDFDGDGFRNEVLASCRGRDGYKGLESWRETEFDSNIYQRTNSTQPIDIPGEITAVTGIDFDRDGLSSEAAVLIREETKEKLFFYDLGALPDDGYTASMAIASSAADNLIGMAELDADNDGSRDELLLLRAVTDGFSLYLHDIPLDGEQLDTPDPGIEIKIPGLQKNSALLGLAVLDADGDGVDKDPAFLELTAGGELWLHAFRLTGGEYKEDYRIRYLTSARLGKDISGILPARMTGLDINRDGFFNELIIFSSPINLRGGPKK
ncbi:MAG: matrixin family metalloprotease [Candidatus Auribacterota bacterium]|nr:matrixin family metalloprotease [Candidatus Auribacterota bacterium]